MFDKFNRQLGIRMIAIDRPGYGLSDFQEARTYLDWPNDIGELADHLGVDRFAVLGWSSGGPYAAVVAHQLPERVAVAVIVAGEGPYASDDYPQSVLHDSTTFNGSGANKLFIWSANNGPWLMQALFRLSRIMFFNDPLGVMETSGGFEMSAKDEHFFTQEFRYEYGAEMIEAFRQGAEGVTHEYTIERLNWPFALEDIQSPTVLVFHGAEDTAVHPKVGEYVCSRIPSCDEPTIYPGEGHSVVYYRYEEIVRAMLEAWQ
jgi:pimeloyl-ACP methyl ester carboxylesterase